MLLTRDDAEAALGATARLSPMASSMDPSCQYLAGIADSVTLQIHPGSGGAFDTYVADANSAFDTTSQAVPGVGDKAAFNGSQLIVRHGSDLLVLTVGARVSKEDNLAKSKALAAKVVSRMR